MLMQRRKECCIVVLCSFVSSQYHQIKTAQLPFMLSETFSNQTFDAVTLYRVPDALFHDNQAQTGIAIGVTDCQQGQASVTAFPGLTSKDLLVISRRQQTLPTRQGLLANLLKNNR